MSIYLATIGAAEMVLNQDLLPMADDMKLDFADGTGAISVVRANGPFETTSTLALVGIFNFFLLCLFRHAMRGSLPPWHRRLQSIAMLMSAAASMMTLHRGVVFSWIAIGIVEFWLNRRNTIWLRRSAWKRIALVASFCAALVAIQVIAPGIYENRVSDPSNLYGRIAQQQQTLAVFRDHLWVGAGFGQFAQVVSGEARYRFFLAGVESLGYPHNTLASIAAETGLVGLVFFILSQLFLLVAFRQLLFTRTSGRLVWGIFISFFIAYWVVGMDLTSGYYSELNMWYMFAIAICFRYANTEDQAGATEHVVTTAFRNEWPRHSVNRYRTT
jgi:O-antigen ligase